MRPPWLGSLRGIGELTRSSAAAGRGAVTILAARQVPVPPAATEAAAPNRQTELRLGVVGSVGNSGGVGAPVVGGLGERPSLVAAPATSAAVSSGAR